MAVPAKIGDLYFEVTADTAPAIGSINALTSAATAAGSLISGALVTAFDAVLYAAKTATALVAKEVIGMGASFNIASQQAVGLFTSLTGSAEEAREIIAGFSELSLEQPIFSPDSLQKTTALLLTFRVAKDEAIELAKNINLAAVALGRGQQGATQLARAIGQIQGRGWLEGDEARQLSEVGINAYAIMADAMGITVAKAMDLGRQHKLLAEDVIPALNAELADTFGPVAQNMLNTYAVQAQGVRDTITGIGSALVEPFIGRTGGGVLVEFLTKVREELVGVIDVTEDGTYILTGALAPLMEVTETLADGFRIMGDEFIEFVKGAAQSESLVNFLNGLAEAVPTIVGGLLAAGKGTFDFFVDMADAIEPLVPLIETVAGVIGELVVEGGPQLARIIVEATDAAAQFLEPLAGVAIELLKIASPFVVDVLTAIADVLELIADNMGLIQSAVAVWASWKTGIFLAQLATESFVSFALNPLIIGLGVIVVQAGLALAALGALKGAKAAIEGDVGWLNEDVSFFEQPFQTLGRGAFALTGGDRGDTERADMFAAAEAAAAEFNLEMLNTATTFADARDQALEYSVVLGLNETQAAHFANTVALAWNEAGGAAEVAGDVAKETDHLFRSSLPTFQEFIDGASKAREGMMRLTGTSNGTFIDVPLIEESKDMLKLLEDAAESAADEVDRLLNPPGSTIDDFLRDLPAMAEDLTKAMRESGSGILGDLERSGVLDNVADQTRKVINTLVDDYGLSIDQIKEMLDKRGLTAIIEALGDATQVATQEVDPLIEKYGELGYSVEVLDEAVNKLEDERTAGLEAQIDAVTDALDAARKAADDAKDALENYFNGETGGVQGAIDKLTLDIPNIGSDIEEALLKGGVQGEAGVRTALNEIGGGLASIFQTGLEQGLSPEEIISMLGPVYGSIQQEIGGALGRIASLDWTDGFTPGAGQEIQDWLATILDPNKIGDLFAGITGSDSVVRSLEEQLEGLETQLDTEVVFSQDQVQGAIDELNPPEIETEPVVTEQAAQAIFDEIQQVFDDDELKAAIDQQLLTDDILSAARAAEDQIELDFNSRLVFDREVLELMADQIGGTWADNFKKGLEEGFGPTLSGPLYDPASWMTPAGPDADVSENRPVTVNNNITIDGSQTPRATASEVIAASAAAASSGGKYTYGLLGQGPR